VEKWESSLATNPAVLTTKMSLTPIFEVVDLVDQKKTTGCRDALFDFLFVKKDVRSSWEEDLKKSPSIQEIFRIMEETNRKKMAEMTKTSSEDCFPGTSFVWVRNKEEPFTKTLTANPEERKTRSRIYFC